MSADDEIRLAEIRSRIHAEYDAVKVLNSVPWLLSRLDDLRAEKTSAYHLARELSGARDELVEHLATARKENADLRAEYMLIESALVDAMGALQFYAERTHWGRLYLATLERDHGKRARVTLDRLFGRLLAFARIQKLRG